MLNITVIDWENLMRLCYFWNVNLFVLLVVVNLFNLTRVYLPNKKTVQVNIATTMGSQCNLLRNQ